MSSSLPHKNVDEEVSDQLSISFSLPSFHKPLPDDLTEPSHYEDNENATMHVGRNALSDGGRSFNHRRMLTRQKHFRHTGDQGRGRLTSPNFQSRRSISSSGHGLVSVSDPGSTIQGPCCPLRKNTPDHVVASKTLHSSIKNRKSIKKADYCLILNVPARTSGAGSGITSQDSTPPGSNASDFSLSPGIGSDMSNRKSHSRRGRSHDLTSEIVTCKLNWITSPTSSAPPSVFSSPVTPKGFSTRDISDVNASPASPLSATRSPVYSPLHSPHSSSLSPRSPTNYPSPLRSPVAVSSHPLPLPPDASPSRPFTPSSPAIMCHTTDKSNNVLVRNSQWRKGKLIGRGTYGSVYVGTNRETGASCAIKEVDIAPEDPNSFECIKQLEHEISVLSKLKHPNIVQYYGSEIVDDHLCIYLEYVHPGSISKYVQEHCEEMTESIVRNFTRHILSGLAYLHSTKTIHRDIKGANLLVDASGVVKLADFGMAKHLAGLSYELSLKGSPHWMAPEVIKARIQKDASPDLAKAVDIWSLGCTVIEMFTGKAPWGDLSGPQAMFKILNKTPPLPETLSSEGKDFLRLCFQRNPADRPSANMLLEHPFVQSSSDLNAPEKSQSCKEHTIRIVTRTMTTSHWGSDGETIRASCATRRNHTPASLHHSSLSMGEVNSPVSGMQMRHMPHGFTSTNRNAPHGIMINHAQATLISPGTEGPCS